MRRSAMKAISLQVAGLILCGCVSMPAGTPPSASPGQAHLQTRNVATIEQDGLLFRDLDRNGTLTPYEDWRRTPSQRAADLLARMTLQEKVGQMVVPNLFNADPQADGGTPGYVLPAAQGLIGGAQVTHFASSLSGTPRQLAEANNRIQALAEDTRLGIPATIASDPRHFFTVLFGASVDPGGFSRWPDPTGFGALGDAALVEKFGAIVARDYRATGFAMALSPQADLATEPRWPRTMGTFGEDAQTTARLVAAYIRGMQGSADGVAPGGVATVVKHFVGYSAAPEGFDGHNRYGRFSALTDEDLAAHLAPFEAAFGVHPAGVMPAYTIMTGVTFDGQTPEPVGAAFSDVLIRDQLRGKYGFAGVVLSDWAVTNDCGDVCMNGWPAGQKPGFAGLSMAWGVEDLTQPERFARAIRAGVDQFGGAMDPGPIAEAVQAGLVAEADVDRAVARILEQAFTLGLFEAPFVDPARAAVEAATAADMAAALDAQARSMVVLEDRQDFKIVAGQKVFLHGADAQAARAAGLVPVDDPAAADFALIRVDAPFETLHPQYIFGSLHHEGSLAFPSDHPALAVMEGLPAGLPLVVDAYLDRPAILTPLRDRASMLLADFGASDAALFDVLLGRRRAEGRLPFELPSSMAAVVAQDPGKPADSADPLYPLHYRKPG